MKSNLFKALVMFMALTISAQGFAAEVKSGTIKSISDAAALFFEKGCTQKSKGLIKRKKQVDCYAVGLNDVVVQNAFGKTIELGTVVIFPMSSPEEARDVADIIANKVLNYELPEGVSIEMSDLRYVDQKLPQESVTKLYGEPGEVMRLGGITIQIQQVQKYGSMTTTERETITVGVN